MTFTSIYFAYFLLFVLATEPLGVKNRSIYVSVISLIFYSFAGPILVVLLLLSAVSDHFISRQMVRNNSTWWLALGITINISMLVGVKLHYYASATQSQVPDLIPLGVSFYALQSVSFLIDVHKGKSKRFEHFFEYLSYLCFFPQLVAGPIERCNKLAPQIKQFTFQGAKNGLPALRLFSIGLFLKLVTSNRLSGPISQNSESTILDTIFLINGVLVFVYVYVDFFSYTLMARGMARLFGVELSLNFDKPFSRRTLTSLWNSWHISLTKWMTDYFYIPVMKKIKPSRLNRILFATLAMMLVGLWHGFSLNFVVFGFINGIMMQGLAAWDTFALKRKIYLPRLNNRFGLYLTLAISGNIFLCGSLAQLVGFANLDNYQLIDFQKIERYSNLSFLLGAASLLPLAVHEFSKNSFFYKALNWRHDSMISILFVLLTLLLFKNGGGHVYFAF